MEMLANGSIDGYIMALSAETQLKKDFNHLKEVTDQGIPLVLFDRITDEISCDKVVINDKEAAYMAVKKLIDNGRKKIALITTESYLNVSAKRAEGYYQALREHNMKIDDNLVLKLPYQYEEEKESEVFFATREIDAVLCVNEIFAIRGMKHAQKRGLKIPEDISFIGFTDGILSRYAAPRLTSVAQHGEKMGELAAQMLIDKVESEVEEGKETFRTEILKATLVERESTVN
jgi:LacI family transcriptional regulator